jgi:hypothetical protein
MLYTLTSSDAVSCPLYDEENKTAEGDWIMTADSICHM